MCELVTWSGLVRSGVPAVSGSWTGCLVQHGSRGTTYQLKSGGRGHPTRLDLLGRQVT